MLSRYFIFLFLVFSFMTRVNSQTFELPNIIGLENIENNNGVAVADYDGDNDLDVFIVANAVENPYNPASYSRLLRNNNNGSFTDVTNSSGLVNLLTLDDNIDQSSPTRMQEGFKYGAYWGDINNDGFPDILFTHYNKIQLFLNLGNSTFTDITASSGLPITDNCINAGATWLDYNNDGYIDIYINDWKSCNTNKMYKNNGDETFTNVTETLGLTEITPRNSYSVMPFDVNSDGWMDIIVTNDFQKANYLYVNNSGQFFIEDAVSYGLDNSIDDMAMAISDFDLDGDFDFFHGGIDENSLLENSGNNNFTETSATYNITEAGWTWGAKFSDFDLDGDEDLFIPNGFDFENTGPQQNIYYVNLHSQEVPLFEESPQYFLGPVTKSVEALDFDYDNDGDMDLIVTNSDGPILFYENKLINFDDDQTNLSWFKINLEGTISNRDAIGTTISLTTLDGTKKRYHSGVGFFGQSLKGVHFGLNEATQITELKITWPSGIVDTYSNLNTNITIKAIEGQGFEILDIQPSQKVYGCIDPSSCSYNPDATIDDGSCTYLETQNISGNTNSSFLRTETYNYNYGIDSTVSWQVTGGEILSGQGSSSLTVKWGIEESGRVSLIETSSLCSSLEVIKNIEIGANNLPENISIARLWNEILLEAIREDFSRPTVHARTLFHTSVAMYDIWAIYDEIANPYLIGNTVNDFVSELEEFSTNENFQESLNQAISYAMYRIISHRYQNSPGVNSTMTLVDMVMEKLGYDTSYSSFDYTNGNPADFGNYVGKNIIEYGLQDNSRESSGYDNEFYEPVNEPYYLDNDENVPINNPNRWQPLALENFIDQSGNITGENIPDFLSPEWGFVYGFALDDQDVTTYQRDFIYYNVFHDPLGPPQISELENDESEFYRWGFSMVSVWQSHLDPNDGVLWDISPNSIGNNDISSFPTNYSSYPSFYNFYEGGVNNNGHSINPITGNAYETNIVPRGDYTRVLAEFWADGPDSETPPGHWFDILNYVNDHPQFEPRFSGEGEVLDILEWNVKSYFILGGGMHDAAISAWSIKGWYDYIRPLSAIRSMAINGQSTDNTQSNYNVLGLPLVENYIETVEEGDPLNSLGNNTGKIKLFTWLGHDSITYPQTDQAGVGWILAEDWYPYQRPTFVTPPFAGYVSGHSVFSRTAAELLTMMTGSEYFPGGLGEFRAKANEFLVFEEGPSVDVVLQWATYKDASDQTSLSRIWGGIHPPADDINGRFIGKIVAEDVYDFAVPYFNSTLSIDDNLETSNIIIYPNPTKNRELYISNTEINDIIEIFDIQGRKIKLNNKNYSEVNRTTKLKFNSVISKGMYLLKINDVSKMIIINN